MVLAACSELADTIVGGVIVVAFFTFLVVLAWKKW